MTNAIKAIALAVLLVSGCMTSEYVETWEDPDDVELAHDMAEWDYTPGPDASPDAECADAEPVPECLNDTHCGGNQCCEDGVCKRFDECCVPDESGACTP